MKEKSGLQQRYTFRKGKSTVEGDPKEGWSEIKVEGEVEIRRWKWKLAWWGSTEKKDASHLLGLRGRHQYSDRRSSRNRAPCVAYTAAVTEGGGGPNGQVVSIKRAADGKREGNSEIIDEKGEKYRAKNKSMRNTST